MKQLTDLLPIVAFLIALYLRDVYFATGVAIAVATAQVAVLLLLRHRIEPMQWFVFGLIVVLGGATLIFHDERFFKWKPTIAYWVMGGVFLVSNTFFGKNLVKAALGSVLDPPEHVWKLLNLTWIALFSMMGALNLYIAYTFSTQVWGWSKVGFLIVSFVFVLMQVLVLRKYLKDDADAPAS